MDPSPDLPTGDVDGGASTPPPQPASRTRSWASEAAPPSDGHEEESGAVTSSEQTAVVPTTTTTTIADGAVAADPTGGLDDDDEDPGEEEEDDDDDDDDQEGEGSIAVKSADTNYAKGIDCIRRHQYEVALRHFSRSIFLAPGEPLPYVARAEAYSHLCDLRSAIANYRKALTLMRDPVAAEDLKSRTAQVLDTYGLTCFRSGDYPAALRLIEESLQQRPQNPAVELHQCLCWVALGQGESAFPVLRGLLRDPTVEADASIVLVQLYMKERDFAAAKKLLEDVLFRHQNHPRILDLERSFDQAFYAYKVKAQAELDVDSLTRCIAAFGEDADLYRMRAISHAKRKSYTLAVQDLFSCINKSGGSNPVAAELMSTILCTIADELAEGEDFVAAATYYGEAIKWRDELLEAYIARGDCLQRLGKHETALGDYKHVLDVDPQHPTAKERLGQLHDTWGSILYNQGSWKLAETEFTRAIHYCELLPAFHYHRALARIMLKEQTLAVRDLISCRDLRATDPDILRLVNQFCQPVGIDRAPPSTASNMTTPAPPSTKRSCSSRSHATDAPSMTLEIPKSAVVKLSTKEMAQLKRDGDTGVELCSLRIEKQNLLDGRYTPTAIRHYVKSTRMAADTSVLVESKVSLKPAERQKMIEMETKEKPRVVPQYVGGPLWRGTKVKIPSRLDLVEVSEAKPVPASYVTQQRRRAAQDAEREQQEAMKVKAILDANAVVTDTGAVPSHGAPASAGRRPHPSSLKSTPGPRLRGFTSAATAPGATFSVSQVGLKNREPPHHTATSRKVK